MFENRFRPVAQVIAAAVFFAVAGLFMYSPVSWNMGSVITDRWDGLLHTWILAWDVHKFSTGLSGFWDANIFWPHPNALAYSDHLLGSAVMAAPFLWISSNPILAHNAVTYLSFALSGLGMFLLARRLTGNAFAGLVAGIIFAYCPWRYGQIGHESQLLADQWLPFALLFFHRAIEERRVSDGLLTGLFFGLNALTSFYIAAIGAVAMVTLFLAELFMARGRFSKRTWAGLALGGVLSIAMVAPTLEPYYEVRRSQGLERSVWESVSMSADFLDYFRAPPWNRMWGNVTAPLENRYSPFPNENRLFAGISVLLLAGFGLVSARYSNWSRHKKAYLWLTGVAFVFSLGPYLHLFWRQYYLPLPYLVAYKVIPGFGGLRVPARFALGVELGLAALAAFGACRLMNLLKNRPVKAACGAAMAALIFAEFYSSPLPFHPVKTGEKIPEVYRWLAEQPGDFAVAELPQHRALVELPDWIVHQKDPLGFRYMYYSTYHWKRLVNGWSGFLPRTTFRRIYSHLANPPDSETVKVLRYIGVKYLILHSDKYYWLPELKPEQIVASTDSLLPRVKRFGSDVVYEIPAPFDDKRRKNHKNVRVKEFFAPPGVKPGSKFNLEVCLTTDDEMPAYTFKKADFSARARIKGAATSRTETRNLQSSVRIDPDGKQWIAVTLSAPEEEGIYDWEVMVDIPRGESPAALRFRQKVGDYPDSNSPDGLKADVVELDFPRKVTAGKKIRVSALVKNTGKALWRAHPYNSQSGRKGVVSLVLRRWKKLDGKPVVLEVGPACSRGFLDSSVAPGGKSRVDMEAIAPRFPGKYEATIRMESEGVAWFENPRAKVTVVVEVVPP